MKNKFLFFCVILFAISNVANAAIDKDKAVNLVEKLTSEGIERVVNSESSKEIKLQEFRVLFDEYLDLDFVGKYVLGRYWRSATEQQQTEFLSLYKELNAQTWTDRFSEFKNHEITYAGTNEANNPNQIFVKTKVAFGNNQDVDILWRVQDNKGNLKIIDIIVENISLAQTARTEYAAFISKSPKGIDGLLENLRSKI